MAEVSTKSKIFSTEIVDKIIKTYNETGFLPRDTPFYMQNIRKRKANIHFRYTDEEIAELTKIGRSILYFANNYAYCMTDDGIKKIRLRDYQERILKQFVAYRHNVLLSSRQSGKCVDGSTIITVNDKQTTIADVFADSFYERHPRLRFIQRLKEKLKQKIAQNATDKRTLY